jgi:hypothetical protein
MDVNVIQSSRIYYQETNEYLLELDGLTIQDLLDSI